MRFLVSTAAVLALACSESFVPRDRLIGTWSSPARTLSATPAAALLTARCFTVQFRSLRITASPTFQATRAVTPAGALITLRRGHSFPLAGRVAGDSVLLGQGS